MISLRDLFNSRESSFIRKRIIYFLLTLVVMCLGLTSRRYIDYLPSFIANYAGDTLWATMVYLGIAFLFNKLSIRKVTIISLIFSYTIEISQLYQASWINEIRSTLLGSLILGHGFLFSDLICYTVGIFIGIVIDKLILRIKFN
jgi:Protein of unknown function (DUF2809)